MRMICAWSFLFLLVIPFCYPNDDQSLKNELSQYLDGRLEKTDKRYPSFLLALQLLKERNGKVLVETGTARYGDRQFVGDGGSTIIFGDWATKNGAQLNSIDIDQSSIDTAKNVTEKYAAHIHFSLSDSVQFLQEFSQTIDFLYLDSYEYDFNHPELSQTHHLNELMAAYPILHEKSVVMVDDCELPHGGQGKLVIEFLTERGWKIVYKGYQTILAQD